MNMTCPFCSPDPDRVAFESEIVLAIWDAHPVSPGHLLIVPRRHVSDWYAATRKERQALWESLDQARDLILERHAPAGFNIGINVGQAAGQTISHLHLHVIPRYTGDTPDPAGGVRGVIPARQKYPAATSVGEVVPLPYGSDDPNVRLVAGPTDQLLKHLNRDLDGARFLDLAVAFVLRSGVKLIEADLRDILRAAEHRVRILAGDYMDVTEPDALRRLLDIGDEVSGTLELKIFETDHASFHPKAYLIHHSELAGCAYVGSSNLSKMALTEGVEWNYRISEVHDAEGFAETRDAFEALYGHARATTVDVEWVKHYAERRRPGSRPIDLPPDTALEAPTPRPIQAEALTALDQTREDGNRAGLVVLATGLGKTYLAAFDVGQCQAERVLFVAHREEILNQAREAFRSVFPTGDFGLLTGKEKNLSAQFLFASVQTLSRKAHLQKFERDAFDYIVIDEFHHAEAASYRRVLDWFDPGFLLGLTATPDRTDGANLLALCGENEVFRCDLVEGIRRGFLSPFRYFGVPDDIDYRNIPWRSSRFDEKALTEAWATQQRAQNAWEQWQEKGGDRTLAFCVSRLHARFMREFFAERGVRAAAVFSGEGSDPRQESLRSLADGEIQIVFAVDMFNEGVDLPSIDTILMLRPTESGLLWLQQLGRGLRKSEGKVDLAVIDYIGNHRSFLLKARTLFAAINSREMRDGDLRIDLKRAAAGELDLPEGCEVTYDTTVVDIFELLLTPQGMEEALRQWIEDFIMHHEVRPTASEAAHAGFKLGKLRKKHGSWFGFLRNLSILGDAEERVLDAAPGFFEYVETTAMTRSFKMVTLQAMLNADALPGSVSVEALTGEFARIARRSAHLSAEVDANLDDPVELEAYLRRNPLAALAGGKDSDVGPLFAVQDTGFETTFDVSSADREVWQALAREMVDWRLAGFLGRGVKGPKEVIEGVARVRRGSPIIEFPPDTRDELQKCMLLRVGEDVAMAQWDGVELVGLLREGDGAELMMGALRHWFGPDAGLPGRRDCVVVAGGDRVPELRPKQAAGGSISLEVGRAYTRNDIASVLSPEKKRSWNEGMVRIDGKMVLLVTLDKSGKRGEHHYQNKFLSGTKFQWQSQGQTRQADGRGQIIRAAGPGGTEVLLFVRKQKKVANRTQPFVYCGPVTFLKWEGEKPITVEFGISVPGDVVERLTSGK